jgi:hypothetical protein
MNKVQKERLKEELKRLRWRKRNNHFPTFIEYRQQYLSSRLSQLSEIVDCGRHSGIPECCISYYIVRLLSFTEKQEYDRKKKCIFFEVMADKKFEYVACPECAENGKFIELKECPEDSHPKRRKL